jgi:multiple antibiotic resistance protein
MVILELTLASIFIILFIGMGPVRVALGYIPIAAHFPAGVRRRLAWRTILAGLAVVVVVMLLGGRMVQSFQLRIEVLLIAGGVSFVVKGLGQLNVRPAPEFKLPEFENPMRLAISPLAVPVMIGPGGVVALFVVAAFVKEWVQLLVVFGLVVAILAMNLAVMLLSSFIAHYVTRPVLEVIQQVMGLLLLALGISMVLEELANLGVIDIVGF